MGYATSKENALKHLETASLADMARHKKRTNSKNQPRCTYNEAPAFKACEYKALENSEARLFGGTSWKSNWHLRKHIIVTIMRIMTGG
jgi:hypothetical protein